MNTPTPAVRKSPVQEGVQIVQDMVQAGTSDYQASVRRLHQLMQRFAIGEVEATYYQMWQDRAREDARLSFAEWVLHEDHENEPFALAYWAATSAFFRKVYQAAAAAA